MACTIDIAPFNLSFVTGGAVCRTEYQSALADKIVHTVLRNKKYKREAGSTGTRTRYLSASSYL